MRKPVIYSLRCDLGPLRSVVIPLQQKSNEWVRRALDLEAGSVFRSKEGPVKITRVSIYRSWPRVPEGTTIESGQAWLESEETLRLMAQAIAQEGEPLPERRKPEGWGDV